METTIGINTNYSLVGTDGYGLSEESLKCETFNFLRYSECESTLWELHLGRSLIKYLSLVILVLGTFGNIMSFIVFSTKSMNGSVSSIFFRALAVVDTIFVLSAVIRYWIGVVFKYDIRTYHDIVCKIHKFLVYWSGHLTGWILSAVAVERAVGVSMPHRYKSLVTRKRAKFLLATIIIALGALDSYHLVSQRVISGYIVLCLPDRKFRWFNNNIWFYMDITAYCFAPFTMICLSNICIIYFVVRASIRRRKSMTTNQASSNTSNLSTILITVSVVYLACTLPVEIFILMDSIWRGPGMTWKTYSLLAFFMDSATLLGTVNSAINFFLYCLSGSSFRRALKGLCHK